MLGLSWPAVADLPGYIEHPVCEGQAVMLARSKLTKSNIEELERRFRDGATVLEAIDGLISESSYHKYREMNAEFAARMDMAGEYVTEIALGVVAKAVKRSDRDSARSWLERRARSQFSTRSEVENSGDQKVAVEIKNFADD